MENGRRLYSVFGEEIPLPLNEVKTDAVKFSRLFGKSEADWPGNEALTQIADELATDTRPLRGLQGDSHIPAIFTYLGQFIAHDLSWNQSRLNDGSEEDDPSSAASPALDLGGLYGDQSDPVPRSTCDPRKLLVGVTTSGKPDDLPRCHETGKALIADPRNDENLVIAQLHLLFIKFHNSMVDHLDKEHRKQCTFEEAQLHAVRCYQQLVLHDYLVALVNSVSYEEVAVNGRLKLIDTSTEFLIPMEFAFAAFRFGHSMVREFYSWNLPNPNVSLRALFENTHKNGKIRGPDAKLSGLWPVDWQRFFASTARTIPVPFNWSRPIDPAISRVLKKLPEDEVPAGMDPYLFSLPYRTLKRGSNLRLSSGQSIVRQMRTKYGLGIKELPALEDNVCGALQTNRPRLAEILDRHDLCTETPLWLYILIEAELLGRGNRLGPVASRLVAEVIYMSVAHSGGSGAEDDSKIGIPGLPEKTFTMKNLFQMVHAYRKTNAPTT